MNRVAQPITITVPPKILKVADQIAKKEGRTRSELFREAIRAFVWKRRWEAIQAYASQEFKKKGIREEDIEDLVDSFRK